MKTLFLASTLLISSAAMAKCPNLVGKYKQCKYTKFVDGGYDVFADMTEEEKVKEVELSKIEIDQTYEGPKVFKVIETINPDFVEIEGAHINPFEAVVIDETRRMSFSTELEKTDLEFTATCTDKKLIFDTQISTISAQLEGRRIIDSKTTYERKGSKIIRTNTETIKASEVVGDYTTTTVIECD